MIRVEYILYNNDDFKQSMFVESMYEAEEIKAGLEKLVHVSKIVIKEE